MSAMNHSTEPHSDWTAALPGVVREVEDFLAASGWDQPAQLFALVPTADLIAAEPGLAGSLAEGHGLTPVAQEPIDGTDVASVLDEICWPQEVSGCALTQDIVVLPPDAEADLDEVISSSAPPDSADGPELDQVALRFAHSHPDRRDARLVVGVLRSGGYCCLLRLRGVDDQPDELVEHPDLAPNMVTALLHTLDS
jgi:hypothetical protein